MRVFLIKKFARYARKEGIADKDLVAAIARADRGLVDAALGGGLIKQRVARRGGGRSRGYRTIIVYRRAELAVFVHGFAKNGKADLSIDELHALRSLADLILRDAEDNLELAVRRSGWKEIDDHA